MYTERIANSITGKSAQASALGGIAEALAATGPDRAEGIANSIAGPGNHSAYLQRADRADLTAPQPPGLPAGQPTDIVAVQGGSHGIL